MFWGRQRYLIDFALSSLWRRKGRHLLLLVVYTLVVAALASVMLFTEALKGEARQLLAGTPEVVIQRMVAGRHDLVPEQYLERIGRVRGVRKKAGRLWGYYYDPTVAANYTLMVPPERHIAEGSVVVGEGIARARGASVGDVLALRSSVGEVFPFRIDAILSAESELVSADLMLVSEVDFRRFFHFPAGHYTDLVLEVANPREVRKVAEKIALALPDSRPILREEILRTYASLFDWREGLVLTALLGAVFAFGIFAWDRAAGLSAEERREIGVLKAVGWETSDVIALKLWEGALVSLCAFLLGYLLAYLHVFTFSAGALTPLLKGWAVLYPQFTLAPQVDLFQLATLFLITVVPYTAAILIPLWQAAVADPDAVMR